MKKILLALMLCVSVACGWAQVASINWGMTSFKCTVEKTDSVFYIVGILKSSKYTFLGTPTLMFKTFDDEVISLKGNVADRKSKVYGYAWGNAIEAYSRDKTIALFLVTEDLMEKINTFGIKKVRVITTPKYIEQSYSQEEATFDEDAFSRRLYASYLKAKKKADEF